MDVCIDICYCNHIDFMILSKILEKNPITIISYLIMVENTMDLILSLYGNNAKCDKLIQSNTLNHERIEIW
jgi:hypothetical protein